MDKFERLGELNELEIAMQIAHEALLVTYAGHASRPSFLNMLGTCFTLRYYRLGDSADLASALRHGQAAVDLTPKTHPQCAQYLMNLAVCQGKQHQRLGDLNDLTAAVNNFTLAVDLTPEDHPDLAARLYNLAACFSDRYQKLGDLGDLEAAWHNAQRVLNATSEDHSDFPQYLHGLAIASTSRHERLGDVQDMEAALGNIQKAVSLTAPDHTNLAAYLPSLALAYSIRYKYSGDMKDIELAFSTYRDTFVKATATPLESWRAALHWASLGYSHRPLECLQAYSVAFKILPEILWIGSSLPSHQEGTQRINIIEAAAYALGHRQLQLKTEVKELPQTEAERLAQLSLQLYSGASKNPHGLAIERNYSLAEIRKRLRFEYFLLLKSCKSICQVSQNGPVVILTSHSERCDAILLVSPTAEPVHVPLPDVTARLLQFQRAMLQDVLQRCNTREREAEGAESARLFGMQERMTSKPTQECFRDIFAWLWTHVVQRIYKHGIYGGRLWWCPTGAFAGLPLHAAAPSHDFVQSYTSTLGALLNANTKKPSTGSPRIGVVGVTHIDVAGEASLPGVKEEITSIFSTVREEHIKTLRGEQATVQAVTRQLWECGWMHFSCHGKQDLHDLPKSCLQLYSGTLELETILRIPLEGAEFVYLAACQTAMGDAEMVNESFHLGGGLITAGFRGAIVHDEDGPVVAETVYSHLFSRDRWPQGRPGHCRLR
ncbi:CHAT domain-containing protein [Mycena sp. CBHHK59/15]|nr:CHAT domain-containing protein [Mycena sp. CBHHK59/15]